MKLEEVLRALEDGEKLTQIAGPWGWPPPRSPPSRVSKDRIRAALQAATPVCATQLRALPGCTDGPHGAPAESVDRGAEAAEPAGQHAAHPGPGTPALHPAATLRAGWRQAGRDLWGQQRLWFARFKVRHNVLLMDEPAVADAQAAARYPAVLRAILEEGCLRQQVFNVDEAGLFWKRLPGACFWRWRDGWAGPKASKDHLTLLLGGNAAGDFKLKPLLVYPSENQRALRGCSKASLPVVWRSTAMTG